MDRFRIDSHKLMYHIPRLNKWQKGEEIYPIYMEIGLHGGCNHRCVFCAFDYLEYKTDVLDKDVLRRIVKDAAKKGVKSILYSGEGEPLLHKDAADIMIFTKKCGIDVALSTNGVMFNKETIEKVLENLTWIRVSMNAGSEKAYANIHKANKNDFSRVMDNLKECVKTKKRNKLECTIGAQFLLMHQNQKEVIKLAGILKGIGVDYLAIKPYCRHPLSNKSIDTTLERQEENDLKKISSNDFHVIFRNRAIKKMNGEKIYNRCLGMPFAVHVAADGDMYPCNSFVGRKEFAFGNIGKKSLEVIWEGKRRREIMEKIRNEWDVKDCRKGCRLDEINHYLWELKNPSKHVNFI